MTAYTMVEQGEYSEEKCPLYLVEADGKCFGINLTSREAEALIKQRIKPGDTYQELDQYHRGQTSVLSFSQIQLTWFKSQAFDNLDFNTYSFIEKEFGV